MLISNAGASKAEKIREWVWWGFLLAYFASKYFVGGYTGFSVNYALSVIALVMLTAILPYYFARWMTGQQKGARRISAMIMMPITGTATGLAVYFTQFIAPNYPSIELANIIHRAVLPGAAITVLLFTPLLLGRFTKTPTSEQKQVT